MKPGESTKDEVEGAGKGWSRGKWQHSSPRKPNVPWPFTGRVTEGGRTHWEPQSPVRASQRSGLVVTPLAWL